MFSLSRKEIDNQSTVIHRKSNALSFMNLTNQRFLTKKIYLTHKSNNGIAPYLYFKEKVPLRMRDWINKKEINSYNHLILGSIDTLEYLNKIFISDNHDLHAVSGSEYLPSDSNVYQNQLVISYPNEFNEDITILKKKPNELLAEDYRNIDVWSEQTTETINKNYRYKNTIPFWQRTMNIRHYDRNNQGYHHADSNRASLDTPVYGYGNDIKKLYKLIDTKMKKNSTITSNE